jgi:adenylate cyclase
MEKLLGSSGEVLLEGEEKTLTVLFADVRGFTSYADRHTPEETFAFLNGILSIMSDAVFKFGGTLDKFIGDEVMAIYGAPVDDPKHALNAVLSAKEMMLRMKEFSREVKIGIGINTGRMIIGNIGTARRMEYTAIGDAVNVAARIEGLTAGDEILIGQGTYDMVAAENILCEKAGVFSIRGKDEGLALYRVKWG